MPEQSGEKSFDATPYRRQQAREQGQVVFSQDLGSAVLLLAGAFVLLYWGTAVLEKAAALMQRQLGEVGSLATESSDLPAQMLTLLREFGGVLLPILGLLALLGALSTVLQIGFLFVPDRLRPDWGRINPWNGLLRIVSLQNSVRLGFGLFKVLIVGSVAGLVLYLRRREILLASELPLPDLARFLPALALSVTMWVAGALLALALFDYAFQRWKHEQDLRMTHQEMREEMKNLQGDPQVIARRRQIQRQMALHRIGDKVPLADVVVTNPTELAVAIQYDPLKMAAPIVVAKGAGVLAQRIRRLALEHNIPIVERKPLAQLLYKEVEVNHPVPDQSYSAVAEVLAYVYQLKGKKLPTMKAA